MNDEYDREEAVLKNIYKKWLHADYSFSEAQKLYDIHKLKVESIIRKVTTRCHCDLLGVSCPYCNNL